MNHKILKALLTPSSREEDIKIKNRFTMGYGALLILVGLIIPGDLLDSHQWVRDYVGVMTSLIPSIELFASYPFTPKFNLVYYSFLWVAAIPHAIWIAYLQIAGIRQGIYYTETMTLDKLVITYIGVIIMVDFAIFYNHGIHYSIYSSHGLVEKTMFGGGLSGCFIATSIVMGGWTLSAFLIVYAWYIFRGKIKVEWWRKMRW